MSHPENHPDEKVFQSFPAGDDPWIFALLVEKVASIAVNGSPVLIEGLFGFPPAPQTVGSFDLG
jgi:hypothetical protein